ncbi:MATE family efflux transporter [Solidesulfovibrio sp.]|jgi:MATE family multidrug resistance protein|uniref:MATE family efflux transporter n=1 Tax=Solidesulfovibrio sp. TaxID=2910990 RepID=UPI002B1FB67A|nr:MATE family efflux transporter [Solidesulfovibrio sp.]MEA5090416.1 MATE family efflux transporter [Solidesulfovibrio sp.]HML61595.1 MATE family efflux transporter [Solidesulfovibrio sp.]
MGKRLTTGQNATGYAAIWALAWPQILMMLLNFLIGIIDVYVGGRIDRETQAAIGVLTQAMFFFQVVASAVANGAVAAVSQSDGAGRAARADRYVWLCLLLGVAASAAILVLGLASRPLFLSLLQVPQPMLPTARYFLTVFLWLLPIQSFFVIANALFRARRLVMVPLYAWGLAAALNALGDFGFGLGWFGLPNFGYAGVAWSTFLSVTAGMLFNFAALLRIGWLRAARFPAWRWVRCASPYLYKVAWPSGLMQIVWHTGYLLLFAITGSLPSGSVDALAGMSAGMRVESLLFLPPMAFNFTASILVGNLLGAGQPALAKRVGYRIFFAGLASVTLLGAALWPFLPWCASVLSPEPAVAAQAVSYLRYNVAAIPFTVGGLILIGALTGAGATLLTMCVTGASIWCVRLPLALYLGHSLLGRAEGVWMSMFASQAVQALACLCVYQYVNWARFGMGGGKPRK